MVNLVVDSKVTTSISTQEDFIKAYKAKITSIKMAIKQMAIAQHIDVIIFIREEGSIFIIIIYFF